MQAIWQWLGEASRVTRSLQARRAKIAWRFSGAVQEFPRSESAAEARVRRVEQARGYPLPEHRARAIREAVLQGARLEFDGVACVTMPHNARS
jgi:hypothetical protein